MRAAMAELPETVGRSARWAVDEYEWPVDDSRPVYETGTEKTKAVGERGYRGNVRRRAYLESAM